MFPSIHRASSFHARARPIAVLLMLLLALLPTATATRSRAAPEPLDPKPSSDPEAAAPPAAPGEVSAAAGPLVTASNTGDRLATCQTYGGPDWTTRSPESQTVRSCNLTVATDGVAYISATATGVLPRDEGGWSATFRLGVGPTPDALAADARTERALSLPNDRTRDTAKTLATSLLLPLAAGTYSFGLLGEARFGEVRLNNPMLSVLFVPRSTSDVSACGQAGNAWEATDVANFQPIVSCPLTAPQDGWAFVTATAAVMPGNQPYEARFRVGTDLVGAAQSDRYVNVYRDFGFAASENAATSALIPVRAGTNTFYFLGYRYAGTGTMSVRDPSLSAIFLPSGSLSVLVCGGAGANLVTVGATTWTPVVSCQVSVPRDTFAFVDSSTSVSIGTSPSGPANEYEGRARLAVDDAAGIEASERRFSVNSDGGDGSDRAVAASLVLPLARGSHTLSFVVRRAVGTQPARLYSPTITVLVPGPADFKMLPLLSR